MTAIVILTRRLLSRYAFSNRKQIKADERIKISRLKIDERLKGYKIYESHQEKTFCFGHIATGTALIASGILFAYDTILMNGFTFLVIFAAYYRYVSRIRNTLKQMIVDEKGENLLMTHYGWFGIQELAQKTTMPIYLMKGLAKKKLKQGVVIKAGGVYGFPSQKFNFIRSGVIDKRVFEAVVSGKLVKYVHNL